MHINVGRTLLSRDKIIGLVARSVLDDAPLYNPKLIPDRTGRLTKYAKRTISNWSTSDRRLWYLSIIEITIELLRTESFAEPRCEIPTSSFVYATQFRRSTSRRRWIRLHNEKLILNWSKSIWKFSYRIGITRRALFKIGWHTFIVHHTAAELKTCPILEEELGRSRVCYQDST